MSEIKWQEPPPDGRRVATFEDMLDQLRANPDQWALVAEGVSASRAATIRRRPGFEAVTRRSETVENRHDLYARYVGEDF